MPLVCGPSSMYDCPLMLSLHADGHANGENVLPRSPAVKVAWFCRWGLSAVKADTAPILRSAEQIDGEADLEELTASSEAAAETGATLATRQADALEAASQELLCSPEVTRCHTPYQMLGVSAVRPYGAQSAMDS